MELKLEEITAPKDCNTIMGQAHFYKTIEDLYEQLAEAVPGIKFGIAFAESSGACKIRFEGNDEELKSAAAQQLQKLNAGHVFLIFLRNAFPVNVLNRVKQTSEVCTVYAATANPLQVILACTEQGNGVLGVIDGLGSKGLETLEEREERRKTIRRFGYKL